MNSFRALNLGLNLCPLFRTVHLQLISGYFDTSIGSKVESNSYKKIASTLGISPQSILFLTHSELEARAAHAAGCSSRLVLRDGNETLTDAAKLDLQQINSFREVPLLFGMWHRLFSWKERLTSIYFRNFVLHHVLCRFQWRLLKDNDWEDQAL